jgi:hypothetical protein
MYELCCLRLCLLNPRRGLAQSRSPSCLCHTELCTEPHVPPLRSPCRGEHLGLVGAAGVCCSLVGMVVLTHPPMLFGGHQDWGPARIWGAVTGVMASAFAAGAFISIRCGTL